MSLWIAVFGWRQGMHFTGYTIENHVTCSFQKLGVAHNSPLFLINYFNDHMVGIFEEKEEILATATKNVSILAICPSQLECY